MESSVLNFQSVVQSLTFKTFYHNRAQQFGYDDLFANQRVIVFSIPNILSYGPHQQIAKFHNSYEEFKALGIDDIYCVNSHDLLVGPFTDKHSKIIKGLADTSGEFVSSVARYYNIDKPKDILNSVWQYIIILNNGVPEQFWQNPVKANMSLSIIKNRNYTFHGLTVDKVKKYLLDNKK